MDTSKSDLIKVLEKHFDANAAEAISARVTLAIAADSGWKQAISFVIHKQKLEFVDAPGDDFSDVTLIVDNLSTFHRVLTGKQHLVSAFMRGNFRSDGYLVLVFQVLSVFRKSP